MDDCPTQLGPARKNHCELTGAYLPLQLLHPGSNAVICLVVLIVLIQGQTQELAAIDALGFRVRVTRGVDIADHLGSRRLESIVKLLDAIAEVVPVALGVTAAEDSHGLPC